MLVAGKRRHGLRSRHVQLVLAAANQRTFPPPRPRKVHVLLAKLGHHGSDSSFIGDEREHPVEDYVQDCHDCDQGLAGRGQRARHNAVNRPASLSALASLEIPSDANVFFSSSVNWSENNPCTSAVVDWRFAVATLASALWLSELSIARSNIHTPETVVNFRGGLAITLP